MQMYIECQDRSKTKYLWFGSRQRLATPGPTLGSPKIVFSGSGNTGFQLGHNSGTISGFRYGKGSISPGNFRQLKLGLLQRALALRTDFSPSSVGILSVVALMWYQFFTTRLALRIQPLKAFCIAMEASPASLPSRLQNL
jgi:hypothetical protein